MVSKAEFADWLRDPVTRELFGHLRKQIDDAKEQLANEAGLDSLSDRFLAGGIAGCVEVLEWQPELQENE